MKTIQQLADIGAQAAARGLTGSLAVSPDTVYYSNDAPHREAFAAAVGDAVLKDAVAELQIRRDIITTPRPSAAKMDASIARLPSEHFAADLERKLAKINLWLDQTAHELKLVTAERDELREAISGRTVSCAQCEEHAAAIAELNQRLVERTTGMQEIIQQQQLEIAALKHPTPTP